MSVHQQGRETTAVPRNAGIDVSKGWVDACWDSENQRFAQDTEGIRQLAVNLIQAGVDLVVMEATGGYETAVAATLQAEGLSVAVVNPRQTRDFAKSMGVLAKTDAVDARVLRDFANVIAAHPQRQRYLRPLPNDQRTELAALVVRRRQLLDMRQAEANRLATAHKSAHKSLKAVLKALDRQLASVDADLDDCMRQHFKETLAWLDTVKGVGPVTKSTLVALLPELGQFERARDQRARRCRPDGSPAFRGLARQAADLGRSTRRPPRRLHGRACRGAPQPGDPRLLSTAPRRRQAAQGGPGSLHAQATGDPQRHGARPRPMESGTGSPCLIFNTVARSAPSPPARAGRARRRAAPARAAGRSG